MGEQRDLMLRGEWYDGDDPELAGERRRCRRLLRDVDTAPPDDDDARHAALRELLGALGTNSEVLPGLRCDYGSQIRIGANCFLNYDITILDCAPVTIGDDVQIGPGSQLLTPTHPVGDHEARRQGWERAAPVTIGHTAWLGGGVIVCPGVSVGENTVIGAGSVVTGDIPAGVLAVGNPARVVRTLDG